MVPGGQVCYDRDPNARAAVAWQQRQRGQERGEARALREAVAASAQPAELHQQARGHVVAHTEAHIGEETAAAAARAAVRLRLRGGRRRELTEAPREKLARLGVARPLEEQQGGLHEGGRRLGLACSQPGSGARAWRAGRARISSAALSRFGRPNARRSAARALASAPVAAAAATCRRRARALRGRG